MRFANLADGHRSHGDGALDPGQGQQVTVEMPATECPRKAPRRHLQWLARETGADALLATSATIGERPHRMSRAGTFPRRLSIADQTGKAVTSAAYPSPPRRARDAHRGATAVT